MNTSETAQPRFFHLNDCAPVPLRPATHWLYTIGRSWVAVAGESAETWWDADTIPAEIVQEFLVKDIADVPSRHTLEFHTAEGEFVRVSAVAFAAITASVQSGSPAAGRGAHGRVQLP